MIDTTTAQRSESITAKSPSTQISLLTTRKEVDALVPEWTQLFHSSAVRNPFAHPIWLLTWFDHYGRDAQLYFVTVRVRGQLSAVAPFYLEHHRVVPGLPAVTRARLLGVGTRAHITEIAQILTTSKNCQRNLRSIVAFLGERSRDWDWLQLTITPEQVCFEPDWVFDPPFDGYVLEAGARAAVVLPLPRSWAELRSGLKPKKREDINRGFNMLNRAGHRWEFLHGASTADEQQEQLRKLVALSRERADTDEGMGDSRVPSASEVSLRFLEDAGSRLFDTGIVHPCFISVDGTIAAGRLTLRANKSIFFSFSGFNRTWSNYGVAATLVSEILRMSVDRGDTLANLSFFPNTAKLRWSEQLVFHQDVILVGTRRRSQAAFSLWWQRQAAWALRSAARWSKARRRLATLANGHQGN